MPLKHSLVVLILCAQSFGEERRNSSMCGQIFTEKQFEILSDNYPEPYPANSECFYLLKGNNCTTHFKIHYLDFDIKLSKGCTEERLEIGLQAAICGSKNDSATYSAVNNSLKLKFISSNQSSNTGFRVMVERIDSCEESTTTVNIENRFDTDPTTDTIYKIKPTYLPPFPGKCCQNNVFSSKHFFLTSPGFPYSTNRLRDCLYIVQKANSNVCRLRVNIHFFSLGYPDKNSCFQNFLLIDGKYICGCNRNTKLVTNFKDQERKVIRFRSAGIYSNDLTGFVVELVQDECPKRYTPNLQNVHRSNEFKYFQDQNNRISWPYNDNINQLKLVNEKVMMNRNTYQHIYFFEPDDSEENVEKKEETDSIDVSSIDSLLTELRDQEGCKSWNNNQLVLLTNTYGNKMYQMCPSQENKSPTNCVIYNNVSGYFNSPGYPLGYYANQNLCYRFYFLPGYCSIYLKFYDFNIEQSYDCQKDYVTIGNVRYCGNYLHGKTVTVDAAETKPYQDITFASDANYCGKGFRAEYQQVSCAERQPSAVLPVCGPGKDVTTPSDRNCDRIITEQIFQITNNPGDERCSFHILRNSTDICQINLYLEEFNLPCSRHRFTINGRVYCGNLTGQKVTLSNKTQQLITYQKVQNTSTISPDNYRIRGAQLTNCDVDLPPPVRLERKIPSINFTEICQLLSANYSKETILKTLCNQINIKFNNTKCGYAKADVIGPLFTGNFTIIQLSNKEDQMKPLEITCD
ncbi:cubilin [Rhynchophorus ferrugineus]|uniref:cubilin n=1 Tax=Rhynchophorus ferrugineus TaxID=354439 RepID=UPI003FCEB363